jgi:NAD(P)-dependent dehydrogenase (short-subunit alcohol dehydrogenase family)
MGSGALDGKVCVVTGAAGVIGREIVDVFSRVDIIP